MLADLTTNISARQYEVNIMRIQKVVCFYISDDVTSSEMNLWRSALMKNGFAVWADCPNDTEVHIFTDNSGVYDVIADALWHLHDVIDETDVVFPKMMKVVRYDPAKYEREDAAFEII